MDSLDISACCRRVLYDLYNSRKEIVMATIINATSIAVTPIENDGEETLFQPSEVVNPDLAAFAIILLIEEDKYEKRKALKVSLTE